jgi:asparagine synthase (glutamine-hydrolysing)
MCGILGWIGSADPMDKACFEEALDLLAHRGPDDRGVVEFPGALLGHRRLSIVDLSATGHQPMVEAVSGAALVFNGEIYNHLELRAELEKLGHRFFGSSDTEVLLHALLQWGDNALGRLNGMWAFAFWEPHKRRLLLARDRFGVKPLYYRIGRDGLAFASEPKALLKLFPAHRRVCQPALLEFLANNALYAGDQSFYEGIKVLPPAHSGVLEGDRPLRLGRYWSYPMDEGNDLAAADAVTQFETLFEDAVRIRLRSDVPVGLTLSGGLDSTAILAAAAGAGAQNMTCFTSVYSADQTGELEWAQRAVRPVGATLISVPAEQGNWLTVMRDVVRHMDGPGYSPAVYPLWRLMQRARSAGVPVLLEGQGADESLAGYPQYAALELLAYAKGANGQTRSLAGLLGRLRAMNNTFSLRWAAAWMLRESWPGLVRWRRHRVGFHSLLRAGIAVPPEQATAGECGSDQVRNRLLDDHARTILPGLLHYGDAISMAHSIESRHPFMDFRLVEWMFRLPTRWKLHDGETKWVLREYLRSHGQAAIGNRRDKKGYPTPVGAWLASREGREIESLLLDRHSLLHEWCEPKKIKNLIERNRRGVMAAEHHLYKLVSTQIWLSTCIDGAGR